MFFKRKGKPPTEALDVLLRLQQERPETIDFRQGATAEQVRSLEEALGATLPDEYRRLLARTNGCDLFGRSAVLFGIHPATGPYDFGDVAKTTSSCSTEEIPDRAIVIGQRMTGQLLLLTAKNEQPIYSIWDSEEGEALVESRSLGQLLEDEIRFWDEVEATS